MEDFKLEKKKQPKNKLNKKQKKTPRKPHQPKTNSPLPPFIVNKLFQRLNTSHLKEQTSYFYISKYFRLLSSYLKREADFWSVDY